MPVLVRLVPRCVQRAGREEWKRRESEFILTRIETSPKTSRNGRVRGILTVGGVMTSHAALVGTTDGEGLRGWVPALLVSTMSRGRFA